MNNLPVSHPATLWFAYYNSNPWTRLDVWFCDDADDFTFGVVYILNINHNGKRSREILDCGDLADAILYASKKWEELHNGVIDNEPHP
jgi:hypothetical protein